MTDHNREAREELIEAARRLLNDVDPKHRPALTSLMADDIRAVASSVFEQAHTPTSDEREARQALDILHRYSFGSNEIGREQVSNMVEIISDHLAAGFRRTVQAEPTAAENNERGEKD